MVEGQPGDYTNMEIAGFKLGRIAGEGGMGVVYIAGTTLRKILQHKESGDYDLDNLVAILAGNTISGTLPFPLKEIRITDGPDLASMKTNGEREQALVDAGLVEIVDTNMRELENQPPEKDPQTGKETEKVVAIASKDGLGDEPFDVAFKCTKTDFNADVEIPKRFREEGRLHFTLNHRNLVDVYVCGRATVTKRLADGSTAPESVDFMVMEYVRPNFYADSKQQLRKLALDSLDRSIVRVPAKSAFYTIKELFSALKYIQEKKVIHRDIKPANIFLTKGAKEGDQKSNIVFYVKVGDQENEEYLAIKLGDLGLAKDVYAKRTRTAPGVVKGTPYYVAREQLEDGLEETFGTDVHSAGVSLYELLMDGAVPYGPDSRKRNPNEVVVLNVTMEKIKNQSYDAQLPNSLNHEIPVEISDLAAITGLMRWGRGFWKRLYDEGTPETWRYRETVDAAFAEALAEGITERDAFYTVPNLSKEARARIEELTAKICGLDEKIANTEAREDISQLELIEEVAKYALEKCGYHEEVAKLKPASTASVREPYKPDTTDDALQNCRKFQDWWDAKEAHEKAMEPIRRRLTKAIVDYLKNGDGTEEGLGTYVSELAREMRTDAQINEEDERLIALNNGQDGNYAFESQLARLAELCFVQRDFWELSETLNDEIIGRTSQEFYNGLVRRLKDYREQMQVERYTHIMWNLDFERWKDIKIGAAKEIGVKEAPEEVDTQADTERIPIRTSKRPQSTVIYPTGDTSTDFLQFAIFGGVKGRIGEIQPEYEAIISKLGSAEEKKMSKHLSKGSLDSLKGKVAEAKKAFAMIESSKKLGSSAKDYEPVDEQLKALERDVACLHTLRKMITAKGMADGLGYIRSEAANLGEEVKGEEYEALRSSPPTEDENAVNNSLKQSFQALYSAHDSLPDERKAVTDGFFNILREYEKGNGRILDLKRALAGLKEYGFDVEAPTELARNAVVLSQKMWNDQLENDGKDLQEICAAHGLANSQLPTIITKISYCYETLAKSCKVLGLGQEVASGLEQKAEGYKNMLK